MTARTDRLLLANAMMGQFLSGFASRIFIVSLPTIAATLNADILAIAWALIAAGVALIIWTYWALHDIEAIFPGVIGANLLLAGGRMLWYNLAVRETERARQERLARVASGRGGRA